MWEFIKENKKIRKKYAETTLSIKKKERFKKVSKKKVKTFYF